MTGFEHDGVGELESWRVGGLESWRVGEVEVRKQGVLEISNFKFQIAECK